MSRIDQSMGVIDRRLGAVKSRNEQRPDEIDAAKENRDLSADCHGRNRGTRRAESCQFNAGDARW
jgi:hypothetical protein